MSMDGMPLWMCDPEFIKDRSIKELNSTIRAQQEQIRALEAENRDLRRRIEYYQNEIENFRIAMDLSRIL